MAGFFKEMFQFHVDNYHRDRKRNVLNGLSHEELVPVIEYCCSELLEGFSQYHPAADRRLAKRIMACVEEWNHVSAVESLEGDVKRCPNDSNLKSILAGLRKELKAYKAKIKENENE